MEKNKKNILILFILLFTFSFDLTAKIKDVPVVKLFEKEYYKYDVKSHETIYSICKRFNVTEAEILSMNPFIVNGLKNGQTLMIPVKTSNDSTEAEIIIKDKETVQTMTSTKKKSKRSINTLTDTPRITIILPFATTKTPGVDERFIEFYKGFLMAVDSLKSLGLSFEVQALESGEGIEDVKQAISTGKLKETDYCIGGANPEQIALLSEWAMKNRKILILPFSSRIPELENNHYLFQTNTPHSHIYDVLTEYYVNQIKATNIIFLNGSPNEDDAETAFIPRIKSALREKNIPFKMVDEDEELQNLFTAMENNTENTIFTSPLSIIQTHNLVTRMAANMKTYPDKKITLMGYPEWQAMNKNYQKRLYELNTYLFSNFYADSQQNNVRNFQIDFNRIFGKDLLNTYPKYGMMGYDIATYFVPRMVLEKSELQESVQTIDPLQNKFKFSTKNPDHGSYNQLFYVIHYKPDNTVEVHTLK
ncbi:MAG: LysM domain-containing protein [Bacteroidales bacterium]|nr:LysM domain-containing protein [Bacteroidales bacterium]MDD4712759.1 LysM domain-containing protein [Bacteroidales bacterium]